MSSGYGYSSSDEYNATQPSSYENTYNNRIRDFMWNSSNVNSTSHPLDTKKVTSDYLNMSSSHTKPLLPRSMTNTNYQVIKQKSDRIGKANWLPRKLSCGTTDHYLSSEYPLVGSGVHGNVYQVCNGKKCYAYKSQHKKCDKYLLKKEKELSNKLNKEKLSPDMHDYLHCSQNECYQVTDYIWGRTLHHILIQEDLSNADMDSLMEHLNKSILKYKSIVPSGHGDLNPANIIIESNNNIKFIDIGITPNYRPWWYDYMTLLWQILRWVIYQKYSTRKLRLAKWIMVNVPEVKKHITELLYSEYLEGSAPDKRNPEKKKLYLINKYTSNIESNMTLAMNLFKTISVNHKRYVVL